MKIERTKSGKVRQAKLNYVRQYALSSKFKLKDKGKEGAVWQEIADEQSDIQKEAEHEDKAEAVAEEQTSEEKDLSESKDDKVEQSAENADDEANDEGVKETRSASGDAGQPVSTETDVQDSEA